MRIRYAALLAAFAVLLVVSVPALAQQGGPPGGGPPGGGPGGRPGGGPPGMGPQLQLSSTAFADGASLPDKYSCAAGMNNMTSPPLQWSNVPPGTASFVLLLHDPEPHPRKALEDVTHWLVYNIPADATSLPEGVKADAPASVGVQGANVMGRPAYMGPCAPPGPNHHYTFELYALDTKLDLPAGASRADVMKAMDGHILGASVYVGMFHRQSGGMMGGPPPAR